MKRPKNSWYFQFNKITMKINVVFMVKNNFKESSQKEIYGPFDSFVTAKREAMWFAHLKLDDLNKSYNEL